jgi:hypothetical protein
MRAKSPLPSDEVFATEPSLRGALATKQSIARNARDWIASWRSLLAMTGGWSFILRFRFWGHAAHRSAIDANRTEALAFNPTRSDDGPQDSS